MDFQESYPAPQFESNNSLALSLLCGPTLTALSWQRGLCKSMKLWTMLSLQDCLRQMGHSEEFWQDVVQWRRKWQPTPVFLPGESHNSMKRQKDTTPEEESSRLEGVQYATGEERRAVVNSSSKNKMAGPKLNRCSVVDVSGGESEVQCCKEQYYLGTWNVRYMNQDKLGLVKQEMAK